MKKCLLIIILTLIWTALSAQDGLRSASVFEGWLIPRDSRTVTLVQGSKLSSLNLTLFHSVRAEVSKSVLEDISDLVLKDAEDATGKETEVVHGQLTYALLSFNRDMSAKNRFLCFQSQETKDGMYEVVLVYMEGPTTIDDLKRKFIK